MMMIIISKYKYVATTRTIMVYIYDNFQKMFNNNINHIEKIQFKFISSVKSIDSKIKYHDDKDDDTNYNKWRNDILPFPWKCYEGDVRVNHIFLFSWNKFVLSALHNEDRKDIINFDNIAMMTKNLFKEATMSIFQHDLVRLHQKQTIGVDTLDKEFTATDTSTANTTASSSSSSSTADNNISSDINNDPFPLTFIFESKLAGLYQHAIERYCMNPNLSIHYQLHEIKSSSIYDSEIFIGMITSIHHTTNDNFYHDYQHLNNIIYHHHLSSSSSS